MSEINIPFPQQLYDKIVLRSGGRLDPCALAVDQVEAFLERNMQDPQFWTEEGLRAFEQEQRAAISPSVGDPSRGFQWQQVFLPNGTALRMKYRGEYHYAEIRHERVVDEDGSYTPAEWARKVANHTHRNAWVDVWVRPPDAATWTLADRLRREDRHGG